MSRLPQTFATLRERDERALVVFVTAGDPFPDLTHAVDVLVALADAGADVIELGVPFSDPLADGPTIQASSQRALDTGMTPPQVLSLVHEARARGVQTPIVLMGAWNPFMQYGPQRFADDAVEAGVDGTIITDLTPEEAGGWKQISDAADLSTIFLVAPTSTVARLALVGRMATGFVYCVARTGVTGAQESLPAELPALIEAVRARTVDNLPVCVGFGVSNPQHVRAICQYADGAVVGSALVDLLHRTKDAPDGLTQVSQFVRDLKAATR